MRVLTYAAMVTKKDTRHLIERDYEADAGLLAVLASPVRLQVIALLHACPDGLAVTDLMELINQRRQYPLNQSTMTHHLRRLAAVGLVSMDKSRRPWMFYRLDLGAVAAVRLVLGSYAEPSAVPTTQTRKRES